MAAENGGRAERQPLRPPHRSSERLAPLSDSVRYREFSVSGEPTALHSADDENLNLHIVGPAATDDSRVLTDYLAGVPGAPRVSIAHSLGLNHNPLDWNIPKQEKYLRIKIWWALFVQDKWTSLAHGTPARITQRQQNVPLPTIQHLCRPDSTQSQLQVASIFTALVGLTAVLDLSLGQIYNIEEHESNIAQIESALQEWIESLVGTNRQIIMHATKLDVPGACNLRLAYLSMKLLMQRIQLEAARQDPGSSDEYKLNVFLKGRQVAEEILIFTQNLRPSQLNDFWLSVGAFVYPTTLNFLLRHALETEHSPMGLAQTSSFQLARQFVDVLRVHKEKHSWDMGDVCLAQHAEIVEKVLANLAPENHGADNIFDLQDFAIPDASILDDFFPSLWDPLQNVW
ncbi:hypothetical protein PWT90_01617 [Aphanocladium album]|nr:hypothetical protein PWT90_01617 [Aphanocladium album]